MLTGEIVDAAEAERIGLVSKVIPDADLEVETQRLLQRMSAASPLGLQGMKHLVHVACTTPLAEGLATELEYVFDYATTSSDAMEGLAAFGEKRTPRFTGK
jgi:enoyl-CoA hydratase/carnithine racemase